MKERGEGGGHKGKEKEREREITTKPQLYTFPYPTCIYPKAQSKCIQYSHDLIGLNVQPGYGHDECHHT